MKYLLAVVAGYAAGWTLSYLVLVGRNFQYYYDYLYLAWTDPGEIPTFVNIGALGVTCIAVAGTWVFSRFRNRAKQRMSDASR